MDYKLGKGSIFNSTSITKDNFAVYVGEEQNKEYVQSKLASS